MAFRTLIGETDFFDSAFADAPTNATFHVIEATVDWHRLRDVLAPAYDRSGVVRPDSDPVLLAKLQIVMRLSNLFDERARHEAADRLSFRRFLGLTAADLVPDPGTLTRFRERLRAAGLEGTVRDFFDAELERHSLRAKQGEMKSVDATIIPAATMKPTENTEGEARPASRQGQVAVSGTLIGERPERRGPFVFEVQLEPMEEPLWIPPGSGGTAAVYTGRGQYTHVIRRVMMRISAWVNFLR